MSKKISKRQKAFELLNEMQFTKQAEAAQALSEKLGIGMPYARTLVSQWLKMQSDTGGVKTFYKVSTRSGKVKLVKRFANEKPEGYFASPKWAVRHFIMQCEKTADEAKHIFGGEK